MSIISEKIEKKYKIIVAVIFLVFLAIGLFVLKDYGISTDETIQHTLGIKTLNLVLNGDNALFSASNKYHGTAFTLIGSAIEKIFNLTEVNLIYLSRHIWTFLLFYFSVICFYLLCKRIFKDWKIAILGSIFLVLSPRIFAHSFFNPKDLPFLSAFIISAYTMVLFLEKKNAISGLIHGISCAFLIGVRILGILVPVLTFAFFALDLIVSRKNIDRQMLKRKIFNFLVFLLTLLV
ncbi:MAG TPA: glycosyltransferase family 39 protein, partial [Candidatus Humimicrobiaceae bacterium]